MSVTCYNRKRSDYDNLVSCVNDCSSLRLIYSYSCHLENEKVIFISQFVPIVLSNIIVEYMRPKYIFRLNVTLEHDMNIVFNTKHLATLMLKFSDSVMSIRDWEIHYPSVNRPYVLNNLQIDMVHKTMSWIDNLKISTNDLK